MSVSCACDRVLLFADMVVVVTMFVFVIVPVLLSLLCLS